MLDHVSLGVSDFAASRRFYDQALAPLGLKALMGDDTTYCGYGGARPFFWIGTSEAAGTLRAHIAFTAADRATVEAFHRAALAAGGRDNGGPGLRPQYHADYYGAFVLDPDGNNIEAVCHTPA